MNKTNDSTAFNASDPNSCVAFPPQNGASTAAINAASMSTVNDTNGAVINASSALAEDKMSKVLSVLYFTKEKIWLQYVQVTQLTVFVPLFSTCTIFSLRFQNLVDQIDKGMTGGTGSGSSTLDRNKLQPLDLSGNIIED